MTPTPKVGAHLGVCEGSFLHTLPHSHASLLARTFASPCFGRKPKAKVVIGCPFHVFQKHLWKDNHPC
jgi:hypothetical protein